MGCYSSKLIVTLVFVVFLTAFLALSFIFVNKLSAAGGVPKIISYQGRLTNASGSLLGGTGTNYNFRFSLWTATSGGTQLWPSGTSCTHTLVVKEGVFNAGVGDTSECADILDYDFSSRDAVYLQVEVYNSSTSLWEELSPRQRINSSVFALVADTLISTSTQFRIGTTSPIGTSLLTIEATSSAVVPLSLRAATGQAADIFQVQNASGIDLFSINSAGGIFASSTLQVSGNVIVYGNFGIGTTTPSQTFSVQGGGLFSGDLFAANFIATGTTRFNGNSYTWPVSIDEGEFLQTDSSGNLTWAAAGSGGGTDVNWAFITSSGGFIRLATTSNRVGIGTTSPYAKLSVNSVGAATTTFALAPASNQTANIIDIYDTLGNLNSVYTSSGNLGLGTTSPYAKLSVVGPVAAAYYTATTSQFSTLPYASTTALTVSGTGGLYVGTITGPLQAISGAVSASSTLSVFYGGTGVNTFASNGVLYGNGGGALSVTAQGGANTVLIANSGAPSFSSTPTLTSLTLSGLGTNMLLTSDGSGVITASSTPTAAAYLATSTATSTFVGGIKTNLLNITSNSATSTFANGI